MDVSYRDVWRVRVAVVNIVLIFIGVVKVVVLVILEMKGKLNGIVMCVFIFNVFVVDLVV